MITNIKYKTVKELTNDCFNDHIKNYKNYNSFKEKINEVYDNIRVKIIELKKEKGETIINYNIDLIMNGYIFLIAHQLLFIDEKLTETILSNSSVFPIIKDREWQIDTKNIYELEEKVRTIKLDEDVTVYNYNARSMIHDHSFVIEFKKLGIFLSCYFNDY